jgi:transposase InsO family protein
VLLRKQLAEEGLDAGAETIRWHLGRQFEKVPSASTVWRILHRRGFVAPQPAKRPRSSYLSFVADLPNEMWQSDMTHWQLGTGVKVEIVTFIDDCSRAVVGCDAVLVTKATHVPAFFHKAAEKWGYPASVLTDNGCIFTAKYKGGKVMLESELERLNIVFKHGKPYHPQTQGKVERFQQTLKQWLSKQQPAQDLTQLQSQLDRFIEIYNNYRPHKSLQRRPPIDVWNERVKAKPGDEIASTQYRIRHDKVDKAGALTIRYHSKLHHIGMGAKLKGRRVAMLIHDKDIRVVDPETGELLRHLELDPTKDFQPRGVPR